MVADEKTQRRLAMRATRIIISVCQYCKKVYACCYDSETINEKCYCSTCDMQPNCNIAANYELFELSHGICEVDMHYYFGAANLPTHTPK